MGTFLVYILKSAACLAVFYLFYKLLMSRDTFHRFNRFALLGLLVLSSLLPLVEASVNSPAAVQETMLTLEQLLLTIRSPFLLLRSLLCDFAILS